MNELQTTQYRRIEYIPPSDAVVEEYALDVCRAMGMKYGESYNTLEVRIGFTEFIKLAARIQAKVLNRQQQTKSA